MSDLSHHVDLAKLEAGEPIDTTSSNNSHRGGHSTHLDFGPLSHVNTAETRLPPFAGELQPGLYRSVQERKIANPAPLGLCGFALTTFVLGCINMRARGITAPNIFVGAAYAYGGLIQILSGMWEMAIGNTFGATALTSYGGFWIAMGITFTPGGFSIQGELVRADADGSLGMFYDSLGLFLMGWFIFTFLMMLCTVKSTVVFFSLFLAVDVTFLLLGLGYMYRDEKQEPNQNILTAGGFFALLAAFLAWYVALAGVADTSNSFFIVPVWHFPWSPKGRASRRKE
ncbi:GPR/FUN34 family protein [Penicillium hispanicum]|uniref:GPR/FUN34 family protein n=1 Tax=Penicillium hispanicum TaxID=1080232 RepID=UPI00254087C7|nr:GPR/FUN34 family protein [Penicillium hispanicum]KAJ5594601.1 GPR/FUN34 family protein [Penicillium hispanicum]